MGTVPGTVPMAVQDMTRTGAWTAIPKPIVGSIAETILRGNLNANPAATDSVVWKAT